MKKLSFIIFILFVCKLSNAQTDNYVGINSGLTVSSVSGNEEANKNSFAFDYLVGVDIQIGIIKNLSLSASFNYHRKSITRDLNENPLRDIDNTIVSNGLERQRTTFQYFSFPVMAKYNFGASKDYFINSGVFFDAFNEIYAKIDGEKFTDDTSRNALQSIDFGLAFGIGKEFVSPNGNKLNMEFRNHLGLIDISKIEGQALYTNSFILHIQYQFKLKKKSSQL